MNGVPQIDGDKIEGRELRVRGSVQGVGFRPYVWRLARQFALTGEVLNDSQGVLIRVWGTLGGLNEFEAKLPLELPPLAKVETIEIHSLEGGHPPQSFEIVKSKGGDVRTGITPDAATCPSCLSDILDPSNRRYRYAFTNCTHCGPRLSIVRAIPYDRAQTSMSAFPLCPSCKLEYEDPADRRFHAQPNACETCGPRLWLEDADGKEQPGDQIEQAAALIRSGNIVAVKGIGGFHLACDATDDKAVGELRRRKHRYAKPFALMALDAAMVREYCSVNREEEELLTSSTAPIVVLDQKSDSKSIAPQVAPAQNSLGFMLPYTPLHHLLMREVGSPIVLTSGNRSDETQAILNDEAHSRLSGIADAWLMHDRDIVNRLDDSVIRFMAGHPRYLRRARGAVPDPIRMPNGFENAPAVLAMGGELKSTFCLLKHGEAILSQHLGDLEEASVHDDYRRSLRLFRSLYDFSPAIVACDLHPDYLSTQWGEALKEQEGAGLYYAQHHHAHVAAAMAEHGLPIDHGPVLGVVLDGLGLGTDGLIWGGEFQKADYFRFERLGNFMPIPLLGGAQAQKEPWRNTYAYLSQCLEWEEISKRYSDLDIVRFLQAKPLGTLNRMIERNINVPQAVSAGRLFDAVAGAIGLAAERINYEGQAAIELEVLASSVPDEEIAYGFDFHEGKPGVIDWAPMWRELLGDLEEGISTARIAKRFHLCVIEAVGDTASKLAAANGLSIIVLSGGVFQNRLLLEGVTARLERQGFTVLSPIRTPANDGGLSLGQAALAAAQASSL